MSRRPVGPCVHCRKPCDENRVYFGVVGPFCSVPCRDSWRPRYCTTEGCNAPDIDPARGYEDGQGRWWCERHGRSSTS
jgi:hypothetical protein